jgi:hypothetical protein
VVVISFYNLSIRSTCHLIVKLCGIFQIDAHIDVLNKYKNNPEKNVFNTIRDYNKSACYLTKISSSPVD